MEKKFSMSLLLIENFGGKKKCLSLPDWEEFLHVSTPDFLHV
jgi:hypothetical protein